MATNLEQGPKAGVKWTSEIESYTDPGTGVRVRKLTDYPGGDDYHQYFTTDGWYDDGRRLLLRSRREGKRNLFSVDLKTGAITQLTDFEQPIGGSTRVNDRTNEVYFRYSFEENRHDDVILGLDLDDLSVRTVVEKPDGYDDYGFGVDGILADDERLLVSVSERTGVDGHAENHDEYPHCAIFTASIEDDEEPELVHEEDYWISHVNASPTRPELFTYCHEGPWHMVDNRIHLANLETDERYQLRPMDDDEAVGHEYWLADGEHVGYHGWQGENNTANCFHGTIRYDNTDRRETSIPVRRTHCHSNTRDLFVCDGDDTKLPALIVKQYDEEAGEFGPYRKLATHAWSDDNPHPHSRFSPDGSTIAFDANQAGEDTNVFLVDVPEDVTELPVYQDPEEKHRE